MVRLSLDLPRLTRQPAALTAVEGGGSRLKLDCYGHWMMSIRGALLANQEEIWSSRNSLVTFHWIMSLFRRRMIACKLVWSLGRHIKKVVCSLSCRVLKSQRTNGNEELICEKVESKGSSFINDQIQSLNSIHSSRPIMAWWFLFSQPVMKRHGPVLFPDIKQFNPGIAQEIRNE
jgi:hypothetical protein